MALLNKYKKIQEDLGIIGTSEKIRELVELIISIAPTNISVLITGESGTGKEVFSKAIHELSPRNKNNMLTVNCGAIPEGLLESELFGHEKGAFTGAVASKKGYFELADNGTILLDEIGEMSLQTQVKLLRVLESGEFMRVGSGELKKVDVRVIAATNRDLSRMVQRKEFRKDLYYRLNVVPLRVPTLQERREDIPVLCNYFIQRAAELSGMQIRRISEEAMAVLQSYAWPGNVRHLRNIMEWILIMAGGDMSQPIKTEHLPPELFESQRTAMAPDLGNDIMSMPLREARESFERHYLTAQINRFAGNISKTSHFIGMERSALHRKLKMLGIHNEEKEKEAA